MSAPRPHWTTAQIHDILPVDIDAHAVGGLVDLYIDDNSLVYQRIRLTLDQAGVLVAKISHQLLKAAT
ncbi:hypothetical protein ACRDU6_12995 [Mycolicibacterium sp. ELW1]|uniref:hypothetical protein n=1 Tax=Mycobacteriaceae TaxID=1762 RepID=UPI0011EF8FE2|nr:hypothetical protein [Mycobacterium sp. ELW1]QEN13462.1 hypothetical protein D3H54_09550 [Mycobacterium sp. ELW1]